MVKRLDEQVDAVFHALADRTRRGLLLQLTRGPKCVSDLAAPHDMSLPAVSKHLDVLERARLVSRTRAGRMRICRADARGLKPAARWLAAYRSLWSDSFDVLDDVLDDALATLTPESKP